LKAQLGEMIKQLRKEQRKTLKEISEQTNLSISFLSQLEHNKTSATLESLRKISDALGVNPSYFFSIEKEVGTSASQSVVQRATDDADTHKTSFVYKNLTGNMENPLFTPLFITLHPGDNRGNLFSHKGQEFLFVLEGTLTVLIEADKYVLQPYESIFLDASKPHYWRNDTDEVIKFLCINSS